MVTFFARTQTAGAPAGPVTVFPCRSSTVPSCVITMVSGTLCAAKYACNSESFCQSTIACCSGFNAAKAFSACRSCSLACSCFSRFMASTSSGAGRPSIFSLTAVTGQSPSCICPQTEQGTSFALAGKNASKRHAANNKLHHFFPFIIHPPHQQIKKASFRNPFITRPYPFPEPLCRPSAYLRISPLPFCHGRKPFIFPGRKARSPTDFFLLLRCVQALLSKALLSGKP